jgi:hypothetical protein
MEPAEVQKYLELVSYQNNLTDLANNTARVIGTVFWLVFINNHLLLEVAGGAMVRQGRMGAAELYTLASLTNDASWKVGGWAGPLGTGLVWSLDAGAKLLTTLAPTTTTTATAAAAAAAAAFATAAAATRRSTRSSTTSRSSSR